MPLGLTPAHNDRVLEEDTPKSVRRREKDILVLLQEEKKPQACRDPPPFGPADWKAKRKAILVDKSLVAKVPFC